MAFCSYFKIQPVAGGADRIKKSEWKLVSHDNSQPPPRAETAAFYRFRPLSLFAIPCVDPLSLPASSTLADPPFLSLPLRFTVSFSSHPSRAFFSFCFPRFSQSVPLARGLCYRAYILVIDYFECHSKILDYPSA